jgi:3-oxoacyl-[acyl-carrier protein] reductase
VNLELDGKTAIVCGASQGIGLAVAEVLAEEGANVAMFARRREVLEREAERIGGLAIRGDVTNPQDRERLVRRTVEAFGGVDILVNNSGGPPRGPALEVTEESLEAAVALLLTSAVGLTNLCLRHLRRSDAGRILNIASSTVREPTDNLALSNVVRPGVIGWAKSLARELGPDGITVNNIAVGRIDTARLAESFKQRSRADSMNEVPLKRFGSPRELADVVAFLASARAGYVTGTTIPVDGGLTRGLL